jgi:hypothetical protein
VAEAEDDFLLRGKTALGALDGHAQLHGEELPLRIGPLVDRLEHRLALALFVGAQREEADETAAAQHIAAAVDGDARQPRLQLRAPFEPGQVRVGLDERVLRDRVGLDLVADDGKGHAVDLALEPLHEDAERRAVAGQRALDQRLIGRGIARMVHAERGHVASHPVWTREQGLAFT